MSMKKAALKLQNELAMVDLMTRPPAPGPEFLVVENQSLQIKIKMYEEDGPHKRPHIHIDYGKQHHVASYAIDNSTRIVGSLHRKYDRQIKEWIITNKTDLNEAWRQTQSGKKPELIVAKLKGTFE